MGLPVRSVLRVTVRRQSWRWVDARNVFVATQDCRIIAIDRVTGKQAWNAPGCRDTSNSWYSMPTYVYGNHSFLHLGRRHGLQRPRQRIQYERWPAALGMAHGAAAGRAATRVLPGDSWKHGGAAVWSGLSIVPTMRTVYVALGNAGRT